jgi:hypothetical protein
VTISNVIKQENTIEEDANDLNDDLQLKCSCCSVSRVYKSLKSLKQHQLTVTKSKEKNHEDDNEKKVILYKCDTCPKSFRTSHEVERHKRSKMLLFKCRKCKKSLSSAQSLKRHNESAHGMGNGEKCPHCNGRFQNVNIHIRSVHDKVMSAQCNECSRMFRNNFEMKRHVKEVHEGVKESHKCSFCQKIFSKKHSLKRHVSTVHDKFKPYQCDVCGENFLESSKFSYHMAMEHPK